MNVNFEIYLIFMMMVLMLAILFELIFDGKEVQHERNKGRKFKTD